MKHLLSIFSFLLFLSICSYGQIINVPTDQPTIQSAINASVDGDTVLVADGLYYENVNFRGKAITLASWFLIDGNDTHIDATIINGSQPSHPDSGSVVQFQSGEDTTSVLYGFTITGGTGMLDPYGFGSLGGGGIAISNAGAKIQNNKITGNTVTDDLAVGGGIIISTNTKAVLVLDNEITDNKLIVSGVQPLGGGGIMCHVAGENLILIAGNVISGNLVSYSSGNLGGYGGGINLDGSIAEIRNNLIESNQAKFGGGINSHWLSGSNNSNIVNNTIVYNRSVTGGGGVRGVSDDQTPLVLNSIVWGNSPLDISGNVDVNYSLIDGGFTGTGNLVQDPLFADTTNYYLTSASPCVDAGQPDGIFNDMEDAANPGFALFPAQGGLRNDMGAYGGNPYTIWLKFSDRFIRNCSLNKTYHVPGIDTLIVFAEIFSPENQLAEVQATITSFDNADIDSIPMFDNGIYPDNIAGDRFYTAFWPVTNSEEDYNVHVSAYLSSYEYLATIDNAASFTTKGPITFESMLVTVGNEIPSPPERIKFSLTLKNNGITDTVYDVNVNIIIADSLVVNGLVKNTTTGTPKWGDIPPEESLTNTSRDFALSFAEGCSDDEYEFGLQITSNDVPFWYGTFTIDVVTGIKDEESNLPAVFAIEQNYPNPFNPSTTIKYSIPAGRQEFQIVTLKVYELLGREVATLVNKNQKPGNYRITWDATGQPSGVYFYRLTAGASNGSATNYNVKTKKMILIK